MINKKIKKADKNSAVYPVKLLLNETLKIGISDKKYHFLFFLPK